MPKVRAVTARQYTDDNLLLDQTSETRKEHQMIEQVTPAPNTAVCCRVYAGAVGECASVALAATHCGKNAPTASGDDGFAAHLSRLASLSPGLRSRRPFTSRWVCREVGVSLASQSEAL